MFPGMRHGTTAISLGNGLLRKQNGKWLQGQVARKNIHLMAVSSFYLITDGFEKTQEG